MSLNNLTKQLLASTCTLHPDRAINLLRFIASYYSDKYPSLDKVSLRHKAVNGVDYITVWFFHSFGLDAFTQDSDMRDDIYTIIPYCESDESWHVKVVCYASMWEHSQSDIISWIKDWEEGDFVARFDRENITILTKQGDIKNIKVR